MDEHLYYEIDRNEPKSDLKTMQSKRIEKELKQLFNKEQRPLFINNANFLVKHDITSPLVLELIPEEDSKLYEELVEMNIKGIKVAMYFNTDKNVNYPFIPPLLRVIYPQFASGRVYGGAICTDLLYSSGWSPSNSIITTLQSLIDLMTKDEKTVGRLNFGTKENYTWANFIESRNSLGSMHAWETRKK